MDHDLKSLQVFMEREFLATRELAQRMHVENQARFLSLEAKTEQNEKRLSKQEIGQAVLRFAVYTIGGTIILTGIQIGLGKLHP